MYSFDGRTHLWVRECLSGTVVHSGMCVPLGCESRGRVAVLLACFVRVYGGASVPLRGYPAVIS
jgi:hypothetical protein